MPVPHRSPRSYRLYEKMNGQSDCFNVNVEAV